MAMSRRSAIEQFFSSVPSTLASSRRRGCSGYQPIEQPGSYVKSSGKETRALLQTLTAEDISNVRPDNRTCAFDERYWKRRYERESKGARL